MIIFGNNSIVVGTVRKYSIHIIEKIRQKLKKKINIHATLFKI